MLEVIYKEALLRFTSDESICNKLWRDIEKRHSQSSRHYHNLHHLEHLVIILLQIKDSIRNWDIMVLAIAYHDIIYSTRKSDNEEKSAVYANTVLSDILNNEQQELLSQFIIATKKHNNNENEDINYFTDADLSILGTSYDDYVLYTKQIRKEYAFYPLFIYKPGRANVVKHFLSMDAIFKTGFFYNQYEKQARENLQAELNKLTS